MFGHFGWQEILLILLIVIILFGASRIPSIMKAMGKGVKEFKKGIDSEDNEEIEDTKEKKDK
ncbi:twin-arginine translocase TatA/TatE family subunit [candidate division WOR-3 bacterium]|nr:twin-arginine translocase TatA/TatE family subunit [candidate division WOR-3 bacterium]MCK4576025.1 twin-arginine translocase TatA/TatE family subunit [candidate division WOR-3 bacterium]